MICFDLIITDLAYVLPKQFLTFQRVQVIYLVWFVTALPGLCSHRIVCKHEGFFLYRLNMPSCATFSLQLPIL